MASALGALRWSPETFWKSTMNEWKYAMKGYIASKGGKVSYPLTKGEVDRAWEIHEQRMRKAGIGNRK